MPFRSNKENTTRAASVRLGAGICDSAANSAACTVLYLTKKTATVRQRSTTTSVSAELITRARNMLMLKTAGDRPNLLFLLGLKAALEPSLGGCIAKKERKERNSLQCAVPP